MEYVYVVTREGYSGSNGVFTDIKMADAHLRSMGYKAACRHGRIHMYGCGDKIACITEERLDTSSRED